jgi:hypothetical protein
MLRRCNVRQRGRPDACLALGSQLLHHCPGAEDHHDAPEVVREHMKAHLYERVPFEQALVCSGKQVDRGSISGLVAA